MQGKKVVIALLVALVGVVGAVVWIGVSGGSQHVPRSAPGVAFKAAPTPADDGGGSPDGGAEPSGAPEAGAPPPSP